jgi:integron integrase
VKIYDAFPIWNGEIQMAEKRLLERVREALRVRHYSFATERVYVMWVRRFILFHGKRHPAEMGKREVEAFLTHLAVTRGVSPSTQNQALQAILFLYLQVLEQELPWLDSVVRAKPKHRVPVVLSVEEVSQLLARLAPGQSLSVRLLYGSGLRVMECLRLRVGDLDFDRRTIRICAGKGGKDRVTILPDGLVNGLKRQMAYVASVHHQDVREGFGFAKLPHALWRKFGTSTRDFPWQYVFPSSSRSEDSRATGRWYRWHIHPDTVRKAVKKAARDAGIHKRVTCHTLRHSFATHLLESGTDIRTIQALLGHKDVRTTMIYTHVVNRGALGALSPLDRLGRAIPDR